MTTGSILVTVTTGGTPTQVTTDTTIKVCLIKAQTILGESGKMYLGNSQAMSKSTYANVLAVLSPVASGPLDRFELRSDENRNGFQLSTLWVDAETNGQKLLITYTIA